MDIGNRIKRLRQLNGITQEELAMKVGYKSGRQAISQIERGQADIPLAKLKLLADALGVSLAYLTGIESGEESKQKEEYLLAMYYSLNDENRKMVQKYLELLCEAQNIKL